MKRIVIDGQKYKIDVDKAKNCGALLIDDYGGYPHSWEDYIKGHENRILAYSSALDEERCPVCYDGFRTLEEVEAFHSLGQLIQLRDEWWDGWKPNWEDTCEKKYCIEFFNGIVQYTQCLSSTYRILVFPTEGMRNEFGETFHNLIEQAKMFL